MRTYEISQKDINAEKEKLPRRSATLSIKLLKVPRNEKNNTTQ